MGKAFIKSYTGVCLEGAVIVLACLVYSAFLSSSAPAVDSSLPAVTMAWKYIGQLIRNYGGHSELSALDFSEMMANRYGWESYGDPYYVSHVLRYYVTIR